MDPLTPAPPSAAPSPPPQGRWYHDVWFVALMLFVVMGPLAFPLLWKSPRFSLAAKIALTVIVTAITGWVLAASVDYVRKIISDLQAIPRF